MTAPDLAARLRDLSTFEAEYADRDLLRAAADALDAAARDTAELTRLLQAEVHRANLAEADVHRLDKAEKLLAVGGNIYGDSASPEDGTPSSVTLAPEGTDDVPAPTLRAALDAWQGEAK